MRFNLRRPTGGYGLHMPPYTKRDFRHDLRLVGRALTQRTVNRGQWNEGRELMVDGRVVHFAARGERVDWRKIAAAVLPP